MKYNIVVKQKVNNMYLRVMELREGKVKLKIKDKTLNKQTTRVLPCTFKNNTVFIDSLENRKILKKKIIVKKKVTTDRVNLQLHNKEMEYLKKDYNFKIVSFRKGWIAGKYIIDIEIKDVKSNKIIKKDYYCSISKREEKTYFLHIAHLEEQELKKAFNPKVKEYGCK